MISLREAAAWTGKLVRWQLAEARSAAFGYHNRLHVGLLAMSRTGSFVPLLPGAWDTLLRRARYCPSDMLRFCDMGQVTQLSSSHSKRTATEVCPMPSDVCVVCFSREAEEVPRYYVCTSGENDEGLPLPPWLHEPAVCTRRIRRCGIVLPDGTRCDLTKEYKALTSPAGAPPNAHAHLVMYLTWQARNMYEHGSTNKAEFSDCRFWGLGVNTHMHRR